MKTSLKAFVQGFVSRLGLVLLTRKSFDELQARAVKSRRLEMLREFPPGHHLGEFLDLMDKNHAQLDQDLLAVLVSGFKRNGYFVEFGATNGLDLSNTALLERELGWSGILAEPGKSWHTDLNRNRKAHVYQLAVWQTSGATLEFVEDAELSTLTQFAKSDDHKRHGRKYTVNTISLLDLLQAAEAPKHIDFLSIDTEGSEFEILRSFDFNAYSFGLICVEHNYNPNRTEIMDLLTANGYSRVLAGTSQWDDWYVLGSQRNHLTEANQ